MKAGFGGALAPDDEPRPERHEILCSGQIAALAYESAWRRHLAIQLGQLWLQLAVPSLIMAAAFAPAGIEPAMQVALVTLFTQHGVYLLLGLVRHGLPHEEIGIGLGVCGALVSCASTLADRIPLYVYALALAAGVALLKWPSLFHRWRGAQVTAFERLRAEGLPCCLQRCAQDEGGADEP